MAARREQTITVGKLAIFFTLVLTSPSWSQESGRPPSAPKNELSGGVAVVVAPFDEFARAWGMRADQLAQAGTDGVINAGWHVTDGSIFMITISIGSLAQTQEDLYAFRIDVAGGETELAQSKEDSSRWIPPVTARRTINVPKDGTARLSAEVIDMVQSVADKLRTEILRRNGASPPTELQR